MTFRELFLHGQEEGISTLSMDKLSLFLPNDVPVDPDSSKYLLHVLSSRKISVAAGAHYSLRHLPCYCLIHTLSGSGYFRSKEQKCTLNHGTLFFADCRHPHSIHAITAWEYHMIYFDGSLVPLYYQQMKKQNVLYQTHSTDALLNSACGRLCISTAPTDNFTVHKLLTDILTRLVADTGEGETAAVPSYLSRIRRDFDSNYFMSFSLDQLENNYQINKYRICKEFRQYYFFSPIQYLHNVRIQNAQVLLQDTALKIHEIGYQVGYENVNHFIIHFKKIAGTTPAAYRSNQKGTLP